MRATKRSIAATVLLIGGLAGSAGAWAAVELVTNGGFETPLISNVGAGEAPYFLGFDHKDGTGGDELTGWTLFAPNGGIVLFNANYQGPGNPQAVGAGSQSVQLEYANDYIEQSIPTNFGQNYVLSFLLSAFFPPGTSSLEVEINNALVGTFAGTSVGYTTYTIPFVAAGASTLIHFENGHPGSNTDFGTYPHLDNISVIAVPEPASLALVGLALAGLGMARRRKSA